MSPAASSSPVGRPAVPYSALLRLTHWLNVPLLLLMIASGLQIWWAYPAFGPDLPKPESLYRALTGAAGAVDPRAIAIGRDFRLFTQQTIDWLGIGGWLAGALRWHFAVMWPYTLNGLAYLLLLLFTAEGSHYRLGREDFRGAAEMLRHPFRTFYDPPGAGKFNPIQKIAYNLVVLAGILSVLTGLAIYKRVQLGFLTYLFGGYQPSRLLHFLVMLFLAIFTAGHLLVVLSHGWRRGLAPMIVGVKAEREIFRERQRLFARRAVRVLFEILLAGGGLWLGGLLGDTLNAIFGGTAPPLIFGILLYTALRLGPVRIWRRRAREAAQNRRTAIS